MKVGRNNIERRVFSLKDFRGVDYASSPLEVNPYRATDMANLLLRDGMLQKRHGFKQLYKVKDGTVVKLFTPSWNNIILQIEKANNNGVLTTVFKHYLIDKEIITEGNEISLEKRVSFEETRTHFPVASGVLNGDNYYLFVPYYGIVLFSKNDEGKYVFKSLCFADMYAPTTTINIPLSIVGSTTAVVDKGIIVDNGVKYPYTSNESINMLTPYRKNKLMFKKNLDYVNDIPLEDYSHYKLFFKLDGVVDVVSTAFPIVEYSPILYIGGTAVGEFVRASDGSSFVNETAGVSLYRKLADVPLVPSDDIVHGALVITDVATFKGKIAGITEDETGYVNIEVYYADRKTWQNQGWGSYDGIFSKEAFKVINSNCITTFGVDGANDRIFMGGSEEAPNIVYFSENDIDLRPNPTYFPANQFIVCGSSNAPVTSFLRVTDGTLAILKKTTDIEDVSVFYVSGFYNEIKDEETGNTYYEARFTVKSGDIAKRGISSGAVINFEGDNIFASETGVYGIQLSDNVASGERYAKERSRTINPRITKLGCENAKSIVYNDKLFLAVAEGETYVADARYKYTLKGDQANTFNYEWFRLTNLFVKEWFTIGNNLYFVDKDDYFCKITDGFSDQYRLSNDCGDIMIENGLVKFDAANRLNLIKKSSYAIDEKNRVWEIKLTEDNSAVYVPSDIDGIVDGDNITLWFCVPIAAYWQSAVMNLNSPMYLKNMWSLSMVASAKHGGKINLGYKTRINAVNNIEVEGANANSWDNLIGDLFGGEQVSLLTGVEKAFGMYTFDVGGYVGINTYRRRLFERNFAHIQLLFTSETTTDCAVSEVDIEYSISRKNIGVG